VRSHHKGLWLVSAAIWASFLRFIHPEGTTIRDFAHRARLSRNEAQRWLTRLTKWWGYTKIARHGEDATAWSVSLTHDGHAALKTWLALFPEMQDRWQKRFGTAVHSAQTSAEAIVSGAGMALPIYLPILPSSFRITLPSRKSPMSDDVESFAFPAALARVAILFGLEFEGQSDVPIAICANVLRVLGERTPARDLSAMTGIAKESVNVSLRSLERRKLIKIESDGKRLVSLTAIGKRAQAASNPKLVAIESRWREKYGENVDRLRSALKGMIDAREGETSVIGTALAREAGWRGRAPYRAQLARFAENPALSLPHFPVVTHRGGYPDGS